MTTRLAEAYIDDGYVVVPELINEDEVASIHNEIDRFRGGDYPISNSEDNSELDGILCVHFPHWVSEPTLELVTHPRIAAVLAEVTGAHIPFWDGRVKCMQSMLFLKPPGFPGQAWHQDERFIPTRDRSLIAAWIALDDATEANGCLRVVPGSHRSGRIWPTASHSEPDEFDPSDEAQGVDDGSEILVEMKAGDVLFFNGYLLHRSKMNRSVTTRRALVNHYMNAWSNLAWTADADRQIDPATHDHRVIVPVVGQDPYPERGIAEPPSEVFLRPWKSDMDWGAWDAARDD